MQYLAWRVLCGLNRTIEISFLLVGHTKFAPDWCFGLLKQKFRKTLVGCLNDLVRVVNQSAHTNSAQLVGREDNTTIVTQFDWAGYFQPFFKRGAFDGIKSWHHLVFSSATPGKAKVKDHCNAEEKTPSLLKKDHLGWKPRPLDLPPILPPPGLPRERRRYLYEKIQEFVPEQHRDTVCPPPLLDATPTPEPATPTPEAATPTPASATTSPSSSHPATPSPSPSPPPRRRRRAL